MGNFFRRSIARQLIFGIALVHAVLMTIFVFDLVERERDFLVSQNRDEVVGLSETLATNGTSWVLANDFAGLEELIDSQGRFPGLHYAMYLNMRGRVLAHSDRSVTGKYVSDDRSLRLLKPAHKPVILIENDQLIDVAAPILVDHRQVGWARVGLSRVVIHDNLRLVTENGLLYTAVAISVGILFAVFMARGLTRGMRRLVSAAGTVRRGSREVHFELQRADELGELSREFDSMMGVLQQREQELGSNYALMRSLIDSTPDLIFYKDAQGRYVGCNHAFATFVGIDEAEIVGKTDFELFDTQTANALAGNEAQILQTQSARRSDQWLLHRSGNRVLLDILRTPYYGADHTLNGVVGICRDITESRSAELRLRKSEALLAQAQRIAKLGSWELDLVHNRLEWSEEVYHIFELDSKQFSPSYWTFLDAIHPGDRDKVHRAYRHSIKNKTPYRVEHRVILPDQRVKYVVEQGETLFDSDGTALRTVGTIQDITEQQLVKIELVEHQEHLDRLAHYDELTGLPNRLLFFERIGLEIVKAKRTRCKVALLYVDLDNFKQINDSLGHQAGDGVLQAVAHRLEHTVRESDTVARLGGDEFVIVMGDLDNPQDAAPLAQKLIDTLHDPVLVNDQEMFLACSVGISVYPDDGDDRETLLRNADAAMYRAKDKGKDSFEFYTADMTAHAFERVLMETELRHAIERRQFVVYYQPQVGMEAGNLVGMEALVRWNHPELGLVSPAKFIPVAEESGLIVPIGRQVLELACVQIANWRAAGFTPGRVSVNLAGKQLQRRELVDTVTEVLQAAGCEPQWLELEVTEGFIMAEPEQAIATLGALRDLGIELAIDDFGTGYSSLSYLKQLPISKLKIDQSFVRDIPDDPNDMAIARAVIALGNSMGLKVIAEGVETEEQRRFLAAEGCEQAQGYLFGRPMPATEMEAWMQGMARR